VREAEDALLALFLDGLQRLEGSALRAPP
jgi:hypothetical protein